MSANALFFVQWCVFLARVHHRATVGVCSWCGCRLLQQSSRTPENSETQERTTPFTLELFPSAHTTRTPASCLCVPVMMLSTWVHGCALSYEARSHELLISFREQESRTLPRIWEWGIARRHPSQGKTAAASCLSGANNSNKILDSSTTAGFCGWFPS